MILFDILLAISLLGFGGLSRICTDATDLFLRRSHHNVRAALSMCHSAYYLPLSVASPFTKCNDYFESNIPSILIRFSFQIICDICGNVRNILPVKKICIAFLR